MPALKGNRYGEKYWIRPIGEEEFAMVGVRLPKSQIAALDAMLQPGQVRSDLLREAVTYYLNSHL